MSNNSSEPEAKGFFAGLTNAVANLVPGKKSNNSDNASPSSTNNSKKANNSSKNVPKTSTNNAKPVTTPLNAPTLGGAASVNYRAANMQPSEAVMEWATTADAPMPTSGMRNVAHGGKRRTHRRKSHRSLKHRKSHKSHKSHKSYKKHRTVKRKTHRKHSKRHGKRRN
jgi:hypothetical protein